MKGEQPRHEVDRQPQVDHSIEDREARLDRWEQLLDARERGADEREVIANERERAADAREANADERERTADTRDAAADEREQTENRREQRYDAIERRANERARKLGLDAANAEKQAFESIARGRALLEASQAALSRSEKALARVRYRDRRQQDDVERQSAASERDVLKQAAHEEGQTAQADDPPAPDNR